MIVYLYKLELRFLVCQKNIFKVASILDFAESSNFKIPQPMKIGVELNVRRRIFIFFIVLSTQFAGILPSVIGQVHFLSKALF